MKNSNLKDSIVIIDLSNLWLTANRFAPYFNGLVTDPSICCYGDAFDNGVRVDFTALYLGLKHWVRQFHGKPVVVTSETISCAYVLDQAYEAGFEVVSVPRRVGTPERGVDVTLTAQLMMRACHTTPDKTRIVIVSGDKDFVPLIRELRRLGFEVVVLFWSQASRGLREVATAFVPLDRAFRRITFQQPRVPGRIHFW